MDCGEIEASIDRYLDRELAESEARALEHHLAKCAACSDRYGRLIRFLSPDRGINVPEALLGRIVQSAKARATTGTAAVFRAPRYPRLLRVAAVAASIALLLAGSGTWRLLTSRPSAPQATQANPWLACGLPQILLAPGPGGAAAAMVQAEVIEQHVKRFAEGPGVFVRTRSFLAEPEAVKPMAIPPVWELSILSRMQNL